MRAKWWVLFIGLNIVISVLTTLAVLSLRGEVERVVVVTTTPGQVVQVTATPVPQVDTPVPTTPATLGTEYTIQPGDTLGGIAVAFDIAIEELLAANGLEQDDIIQPGQVLIIPLEGAATQEPATPRPETQEPATPRPATPSPIPATATSEAPTPFPTETPTPPGPVQVRIQEVLAPGLLEREGIVLVNRGRTVNLQSWTLAAAGGEAVYEFPRLTLAQGVPITVYTTAGNNSPQALYWGLDSAQWDESGIIIELRDAEGDLVATFPVE